MNIREAVLADLPDIEDIYRSARKFMAESGNPTQWGEDYPPTELLCEDIAENRLYVCTEDDEIIGVFCFFIGTDPTYVEICDGQWLNSLPYGVIHRIAVKERKKGVASFCFEHCMSECGNIKIDTHRNNIPMQKTLAKSGFRYCGVIHIENGDERIAFQKSNQDK